MQWNILAWIIGRTTKTIQKQEIQRILGDVVVDMGIGSQHAMATCLNGSIYAYYAPDSFMNEMAEPSEEDFILSPLSFRDPLRGSMPRITKVPNP